MPWEGKRRAQLPKGWAALRKRRLELDGYRCTARVVVGYTPVLVNGRYLDRAEELGRCPDRATDVHHALAPHDHRIEALASLCAWHHQQHTQREAQEARARNPKPTQARPKAKHPGLR